MNTPAETPNWRSIRQHSWSDENYDLALRLLKGEPAPDVPRNRRYKMTRRLRFYEPDPPGGIRLRSQYVPRDYARTTFRVVPERRIDATIRAMVEDPLFVAYSRDALYSKIIQAGWIGITRARVHRYLRENPLPVALGLDTGARRDPVRSFRPPHPNFQWQMDLADMSRPDLVRANDGYKYLLVLVDIFSKFLWIRPLKTKAADEVARHLHSVFMSGDIPKRLQSDQGGEFQGEVNTLCARFGVARVVSPSYSPMTNGVVENANKHIKRYLSRFMQQFRDAVTDQVSKRYVDILDRIAFNLNTTKRRPTGLTAFQVHRGTHVDVPVFTEGLPEVRFEARDDPRVAAVVEESEARYERRTREVQRRIRRTADSYERRAANRTAAFEPGQTVRIKVAQTLSPGTMQYVPIRIGTRRLRLPGTGDVPDLVPFAFTSRWEETTYRGTFRVAEIRSRTSQTRGYVLAPTGNEGTRVERLVDPTGGPAQTDERWDPVFLASMLMPADPRPRPVRPQYDVPVDLSMPRPISVAPIEDYTHLTEAQVARVLADENVEGRWVRVYALQTDGALHQYDGRIVQRDRRRTDSYGIRFSGFPGIYWEPLTPELYDKRQEHGWLFIS